MGQGATAVCSRNFSWIAVVNWGFVVPFVYAFILIYRYTRTTHSITALNLYLYLNDTIQFNSSANYSLQNDHTIKST